jgi:tellurite resistance protein TerC
MTTPLSLWIGFNAVIVALLAVDLTLLQRERRGPSLVEAVGMTVGWMVLAGLFGLWIVHHGGAAKGLEFFTGYVIEYALSVDNIFIFVLVFGAFQVASCDQHRLLFWGVLGALVMRGVMIFVGTALLQRFEWVIYLFGAYIVYAGVAMLWPQRKMAVEELRIVRGARRFLPLSRGAHGGRFVLREEGRWKFSMLFLVLVVIELTDLVFALDSIPAVFGVTRDPFIVYTSNICAILGLRSLYFLLAHAVRRLVYLHFGLAAVLIFIGAKMLSEKFYQIPTSWSLVVVAGLLLISAAASLFSRKGTNHGAHS